MPIKLERNKADKVHLGHRLGIFYIQSSNACDPKSYFSKNVIFLQENVAWLCAFPLKDCNVYLKRVQWWSEKNKNKLIRIQFHRNMAPSANRFQHHSKLRSIYIFIFIYLLMYLYIYTIVFFAIMPFFELNVDNYLEYVPSKKCIISLKRVQDSLQP
jgi:hypothetical protein